MHSRMVFCGVGTVTEEPLRDLLKDTATSLSKGLVVLLRAS